MRKRSRIVIYKQTLDCMKKEPEIPTHIMYRCNLSWVPMKEILTNLKNQGFIVSKPIGKRIFYKLTDKGRDFLKWCENPVVKGMFEICEKDLDKRPRLSEAMK